MKSPTLRAHGRFPPRFVADFDSATAMVRALARFLRGKDFPGLGILPSSLALGRALNALPEAVRIQQYIWGGWGEAIPASDLPDVRAEELSRWVAAEYPARRYPAVMVGSSNGAAVHLCAAMGIPWLPQTFLIPVRCGSVHRDEPRQAIEWGRRHAPAFLAANPDLALHHMHDPNQDRLMIRKMTYFRVKRLRLGEQDERFLAERLDAGGTIVLLDCTLTWPTTRVGERHVFQHGAPGGATPEQYHQGDGEVEALLRRDGSHRRRWDPPEPDGDRPEAEWGFDRSLAEDVRRFAREQGYRVERIVLPDPDDLSPVVADFHRAWYRERGLPADRLLLESFILLDPWWALRTGSVPFWTKFSVEPSVRAVEAYLDEAEPYDEMRAMLFPHGVDSIGLATAERWRRVLARARQGGFIGTDPESFPRDFGAFLAYGKDLREKLPARHPMPASLARERVHALLRHVGLRNVTWASPG